jgi:quercetin dioxygenase-like cupin family protein
MSQFTTWDDFPVVEYLPGIFRQAVCGERVMMTRIRYEKGAVIPDHHHEAEQVMLVVQGRLWAKVGDEDQEVGPGALLTIPSNVTHAFRHLGEEDVVFYECFAPIRLEYLIGYKGPDPVLEAIKKAKT